MREIFRLFLSHRKKEGQKKQNRGIYVNRRERKKMQCNSMQIFAQENGKWKLHEGKRKRHVTSKS
jgi:hypothetical protein